MIQYVALTNMSRSTDIRSICSQVWLVIQYVDDEAATKLAQAHDESSGVTTSHALSISFLGCTSGFDCSMTNYSFRACFWLGT